MSRFRTTSWTLVRSAGDRASRESSEALAALCEAYWSPLYAYVRSRGHAPDEASDLTQAYFALLLEKDWLRRADRDAGRFRAFLLTSVKHMLSHERARASAMKRGAGRAPVALDIDEAESQYRALVADGLDPERAFERKWALTVVQRALDRLRGEFVEDDRERHFELLKPFLMGGEPQRPYREIAAALEMTEPAVKMAVLRLRRRLGRALRDEIAETVEHDSEVDAEVRYLLGVLGAG